MHDPATEAIRGAQIEQRVLTVVFEGRSIAKWVRSRLFKHSALSTVGKGEGRSADVHTAGAVIERPSQMLCYQMCRSCSRAQNADSATKC